MIPEHELNRRHWDEITSVHVRSEFYDVAGFLAGRSALDRLELAGLGEISGRKVLHLQCHFGLGSLELARRGAMVTGVDFSIESVAEARELASQMNLSGRSRFVGCDVLELDQHLAEDFDVVFTSYGAINWLSNLSRWGCMVSHFLRPGGRFFMVEIHPAAAMFEFDSGTLRLKYDYFNHPAGVVAQGEADYANSSYVPTSASRYWAWTLDDVFNALRNSGIHIDHFREYPFSCYAHFPSMTCGSDGFWHLPEGLPRLPLLFAIGGTRS